MAARSPDRSKKKKSLTDELAELTKAVLYNMAKAMDIPGRSQMAKEELIAALGKKAAKVKDYLASLQPSSSEKEEPPQAKVPKAAEPPKIAKPVGAKASETKAPKAVPPVATKKTEPEASKSAQPAVAKKAEPTVPQAKKAVSAKKTRSQPTTKPASPPDETTPPPVWQGEEGPELPESYGETVLRAMSQNPHTAYVYWDFDEKTQEQIQQEAAGEIPEAVLRVYGESDRPPLEIPVELKAHHCYVNLTPNHTYAFEIGIKHRPNRYRTLVRSNLLTLPPESASLHTEAEEGAASPFSGPSSWVGPPSTKPK